MEEKKCQRSTSGIGYVWPTPVGVLMCLLAISQATFGFAPVLFFSRLFLTLGILGALAASMFFSVRLTREDKKTIPRWIRYLNISFAPVLFAMAYLGLGFLKWHQ